MTDDLISRAEAIEILEHLSACKEYGIEIGTDEETYIGKYEAITAISDLPSADRPQGEWKHLKGDEWLCPECGHVIWTEGSWEHPLERGKFYCENCGADLKGAEDVY